MSLHSKSKELIWLQRSSPPNQQVWGCFGGSASCSWCLGLDEGFLNSSVWCWGHFHRSLEVPIKNDHQKVQAVRDLAGTTAPSPSCCTLGDAQGMRALAFTAWLGESRQRTHGQHSNTTPQAPSPLLKAPYLQNPSCHTESPPAPPRPCPCAGRWGRCPAARAAQGESKGLLATLPFAFSLALSLFIGDFCPWPA